MEVKGDDYSVTFCPATATVLCEGTLRLLGSEGYEKIVSLLNTVAKKRLPAITLDMKNLKFLNSSGINVFSKFVIAVRNQNNSRLTLLGSSRFPWQSNSLRNMKRLMPDLILEIE